MKEYGFVGRDTHKLDHPLIPEIGGTTMTLGIMVSTLMGFTFLPEKGRCLSIFFLKKLKAGKIEAIDDLKPFNAKLRRF